MKQISGTNCANCSFTKGGKVEKIKRGELNDQGGLIIKEGKDLQKAQDGDLVTLPGTGAPKEKHWCTSDKIDQFVTERMCCAYWTADGTYRQWENKMSKKVTEDFARDQMSDTERVALIRSGEMGEHNTAQPIKITAKTDIPTMYMKAGDSTYMEPTNAYGERYSEENGIVADWDHLMHLSNMGKLEIEVGPMVEGKIVQTESIHHDGYMYQYSDEYEDDNVKRWHYAMAPGDKDFTTLERSPYLPMEKEDFAKFVAFHKEHGRWPGYDEARLLEGKESKTMDKELQDILKLAGLKTPIIEWAISDVERAMKKQSGKVDQSAINKLKELQRRGNVTRQDLEKVGYGNLLVEDTNDDKNQDGEDSPLTYASKEVVKMHRDGAVEEAIVDEADVEEDFLAPKPDAMSKYDDVEEVMEADPEQKYQDIEHHCTAEEIGHCEICGDWMDPMGTVHGHDSDPLKAYESTELDEIAPVVGALAGAAVRGAAAAVGSKVADKVMGVDEAKAKKAKKVAKPVADDDADDEKDVGDKIVDIGDDEEFDFESEFDKSMGTTRSMYEMNELRKLAGLPIVEDEGDIAGSQGLRKAQWNRLEAVKARAGEVSSEQQAAFNALVDQASESFKLHQESETSRLIDQLEDMVAVDWNAEVDAFRNRMEPDTGRRGMMGRVSRRGTGPSFKLGGVAEDAQVSEHNDTVAFVFDNEEAYYLAADLLGALLDFGPNDEILVPKNMVQSMYDELNGAGFDHGEDFTEMGEVDEDLQNGYEDHHMVDGQDMFPKGATSQPAGDIGPGGAKHGDNPMSTRMKTAENKIYESYKLAYRRFRRDK